MRHGHARIVNISGVAHATPMAKALAKKLGHRETRLLTAGGFMDGVIARDMLARFLTRGIELNQSSDGRLDLRGLADHVLRAMKRPPLTKMVALLAELLDRGIGLCTKNGNLETNDLAAFVLRTLDA